ncbi:MAG: hypothetical protein ABS98_05735 [Lysobacteraceae bacterium SCN 69-48]|nr:MAG: hypothetical protein ABS98_05735 [Xanthomonadaceae bacterium SCN 69-48]
MTGTLKADGTAIAVGELIDVGAEESVVTIGGDYSFVASAGSSPFNAAAYGRVTGFGANPIDLDANAAVFDLSAGLVGNFNLAKLAGPTWNPVIPAGVYTASLQPVSADASKYNLPVLADVDVGEILRNGTTLQAPLAQIPGGWKSRLVLTNTSGVARPYTISLLNVAGETAVTPGTLTGTIPANGTKVIDDLSTVFTGNNRATLVVDVAAPNTSVQGLYQIVNPDKGSISNHVLVRPGTN